MQHHLICYVIIITVKKYRFLPVGKSNERQENLFCCMNHNKNLRLRNRIYHRALVCIFVFNKILKKLLYWIYILYQMTECLPVLICHGLIWYQNVWTTDDSGSLSYVLEIDANYSDIWLNIGVRQIKIFGRIT